MSQPNNTPSIDSGPGVAAADVTRSISKPGFHREKPLAPSARFVLTCSAIATLLLCFVFVILAIPILLAMVAVELALVIGALRFGLAGILIPVMQRHLGLLRLFLGVFGFHKETKFRIPLQPEDAPELFAVVQKLCQQLQLTMPGEVALEMGPNAWVRLKGYGRGEGTTILGIGYDLLAGLNEKEMEGVLAHELVHAKLIQRGFRNLIWMGLSRFAGLTTGLAAQAHAFRRAKKTFETAEFLLRPADSLTRLLARLVATYSRQDEFDADRGAAELCGGETVRSALNKLHPLSEKVSRLPWSERVAQLQAPQGFSRWLVKELTLDPFDAPEPDSEQIFNRYSTHPLMRDRIAALENFGSDLPAPTGRPAISLLKEPDAAAQKLLGEIQRVLAEQEEKDSKQLRSWTKKAQRNSDIHPLQLVGFLLALGGFIVALVSIFGEVSAGPVIVGALMIVGGILICLRSGFKDRLTLPVPDYAVLKEWKLEKLKDIDAVAKQIEKELIEQIGREKKKRAKVLFLMQSAYDALSRCDYLRAHVASRLAHNLDKHSAEALIGLSVAASALNMREQAGLAIGAVRKKTGFKTKSSVWCAGWTLLLLGDWNGAEGFLDQAVQQHLGEPTLLILLSVARARRGKSQSAIQTARKACSPSPRNKHHAQYYINLLIDNGQLLQARQAIQLFATKTDEDIERMLSLVRLNLLQQDFESAQRWTELATQKITEPYHYVCLGHAYELARKNEQAAGFFKRALQSAHFPEACLALGRLELHARNKTEARRYFLNALNTVPEVGENGANVITLFPHAVGQLVMLNEPMENCRAWIATCGKVAPLPAFANSTFLVYASEKTDAEKYFHEIVAAMQPNKPPALGATVTWREAPRDQQPVGPVKPGLQCAIH